MPVRLDAEEIAEYRAKAGKIKETISRLRRLKEGKESDLWKELGPFIKRGMEANEKMALISLGKANPANQQGDYADSRIYLGKAQAYGEIYRDVEMAEIQIEKAENELQKLTAKINRAEKQGGII